MKLADGLVVTILALGGIASAFADDICSKQPSDGALYQCMVQQKKLAEDDLNKEYAAAKKRIVQMYGSQKQLGDQYVAIVVDTQRSWLPVDTIRGDLGNGLLVPLKLAVGDSRIIHLNLYRGTTDAAATNAAMSLESLLRALD
ncbi:lysozyme inhibitor LprI family protein [Pectobacterium atrosepticum]|uniref:lysozyme inhibitor LprI family protein n=1 Tax=Pectobacterium atrosepticum TaxID=29471 RepID=UPI00049ABF0A|nr:lysozyme inhibitor LprI family protein [Pectobacterium atrosepticum]AIA70988.1 hypothetical protein EV46_10410 [Pectobacterium atrosepticum]AIK14187.1 hypothetical protein GZ59_23900 [Pectobacterium atrosepticum]POW29153.1 hypothetical protein PB72LOC_01948 [Pectobacterium atrosepticum]